MIFLSFQLPKNADFKNFRGFVRTPRTPPPYGPAAVVLEMNDKRNGTKIETYTSIINKLNKLFFIPSHSLHDSRILKI